jgi:hypothetical protein
MINYGWCFELLLRLRYRLLKNLMLNLYMNPIKACIFDLDGVVVDTAKYHYLAWKRLAHELGFEFMTFTMNALKG